MLLAGAVLAGCDATVVSPPRVAQASPPPATAQASVTPSGSPAPSESTRPSAQSTPTPAPTPGQDAASITDFRWTHKQRVKLRDIDDTVHLARTPGGWLAWTQSNLQFSPDLVHWRAIIPGLQAGDELNELLAGASANAQVAFGSIDREDPVTRDATTRVPLAITSSDGKTWLPIVDPAIAAASITGVGFTCCDLILAGRTADGTATTWTSPDGQTWTSSADPDAAAIGAGVLAFTAGPDGVLAYAGIPIGPGDVRVDRIGVWRSADGLEWERVGVLPDSARGSVDVASYGNGHWLVLGTGRRGRPYTWTSTDGIAWQRIARKHVVGVTDVGGYEKGFIAVGQYGDAPGTTCGSGAPYVGRTWVSDDGVAWTEVSRSRGVAMLAVATFDGRLYGIGNTTKDDAGRLWWGALPGAVSVNGPATLGPLPPGTGGCGE